MEQKYYIARGDGLGYELYHHGILGMHWGIRRFQNSDGSLTAEGRKRYGIGDDNPNVRFGFNPLKGGVYIENHKAIDSKSAELRAKIDTATDLFQKYNDDFVKSANAFASDQKSINKIVSELKKDFGSYDQIDDEEYLEDVLDDYVVSALSKKTASSYQKYRSAAEDYYSSAKKIANDIIGKYGNEPIEVMDYKWLRTSDYKTAVQNAIYSIDGADARFLSYLLRHEEVVYSDGDGYDAVEKVKKVILNKFKKM
jgi:hypothetical protein